MNSNRPLSQPFPDFHILGKIGAGSMGAVFLARQRSLDRLVALKVLKPSLSKDAHYVNRLKREAQLVARLDNPNIVTAYDLREEKGYHVFVMEYVEGRSLRDLLRDWGRLPEEQVINIGLKLANALAHANRHGVIHRDVKPANILVQSDDVVKLADLGLAKGPEAVTLTRDGSGTLGTPLYMSPEQARDSATADIRSDIYSLGATLSHAASGVAPFSGVNLSEVLTKVLQDDPVFPRDAFPEISKGFDLVIRKCLVKDPGRRYQRPEEMVADLERVRVAAMPTVDLKALQSRPRSALQVPAIVSIVVFLLFAFGTWHFTRDLGGGGEQPPSGLGMDGVVKKIASRFSRSRNADLPLLLQELAPLVAKDIPGAHGLQTRITRRLGMNVFQWTASRAKGLVQRLTRETNLAAFPALIRSQLDNGFFHEFGVMPASLPVVETRNIFLNSRQQVENAWRARVEEAVNTFMRNVMERERAVEDGWWDLPHLAYKRRWALLKKTFADLSLPALPPAEVRSCQDRWEQAYTRLDLDLKRQAAEKVKQLQTELPRRIKDIQGRVRDGKRENVVADYRYFREEARELRQVLRDATPTDDALPGTWGLAWSRASFLYRIRRLEEEIDQALAKSEALALDRMTQLLRAAFGRRDYAAARTALAGEIIVTNSGRASLAKLQREHDLLFGLEEQVLVHIRKNLIMKEINLAVDGVVLPRRILRTPRVPGGGILLVITGKNSETQQIPFAKVDRVSLVDQLLPDQWRQANPLAVGLFLVLGDKKAVALARKYLGRVPPTDRPALAARIKVRSAVLNLPDREREKLARQYLDKLAECVALNLPQQAIDLTNKLRQNYGKTKIVGANREKIEAFRRQAQEMSKRLAAHREVRDLFRNWGLLFALPTITATANLRDVHPGFLPPDRWGWQDGGIACTRPAKDLRSFIGHAWSLPTNLSDKGKIKAGVVFQLPPDKPAPALFMITMHGVHAALVQAAQGRRITPRWAPLLTSSGLQNQKFPAMIWSNWLADRPNCQLIPGCTYTLEVVLEPVFQKARQVSLFLDGKQLGPSRHLPVPAGARKFLEFRLAGEALLQQVVLTGIPVVPKQRK